MSSVFWQGKHYKNHISVGKDKSFDKTTVQGAVDKAKKLSLASDNPGLITVDVGHYLEAVQIAGVTDLTVASIGGAIIVRDSTITTTPGGTMNIGNAAFDTTARIRIEGLHVVSKDSGGASGAGGPPEGAIFVGQEETFNDSGNGWDEVIIRNCVIDGVHDAVQMFGQNRDGGANTTAPAQMWLSNNVIRCAHDAVTTKGRMRGYSSCNQVYVNAGGISPYLTSVDLWKTTGYHHNVSRGGGDDEGTGFWYSNGDTFHLESGTYSEDFLLSGIYIYAGGKNGTVPMRHRFVSPTIRVDWNDDFDSFQSGVWGAMVDDVCDCPSDDWLVIQGGSIEVYQHSSHGSAPANAIGVGVEGDSGGAAVLRVIGTHITAESSGAGSSISLNAVTADSEIQHHAVISDQATDDNGATGAITRLSEL